MEKVDLKELFSLWNFDDLELEYQDFSMEGLEYEYLTQVENKKAILRFLKTLEQPIPTAGPHRKADWESGWGQNLSSLEQGHATPLLPGYFEKSSIIRFKQEWIRPQTLNLESHLLSLLVDSLILKHAKGNSTIYEFGCGTGHHLFRLAKKFSDKTFVGLDWAKSSQEVIRRFATLNSIGNVSSANFDFFNPNRSIQIEGDSTFLTVAALEQVGESYKEFIEFVLEKRPQFIINVEPMEEFLDEENLLDWLSIRYFEKRHYLHNYFNYLKQLEKEGRLSIVDSRRTFIGSFYVDGYSVVVWSPS